MTHSDSVANIATALAKAQGVMEAAAKDSTNPHFGSRYADLASVRDACQAALSLNEIAVLQSPSADGNLVRMVTLLLHSSGEWVESDVLQVQARDAAPQAVGSCLTYLRRYQLAAMTGVTPDDDDAESGEGRAAGEPKIQLRESRSPDGDGRVPVRSVPLGEIGTPSAPRVPPVAQAYGAKTPAAGSEPADSRPTREPGEDDGDRLPPGFALIDRLKEDGDWLQVTWGRNAAGESTVYKTKIPTIAGDVKQAYTDRVPVKLRGKKFPYIDKVERLDAVEAA